MSIDKSSIYSSLSMTDLYKKLDKRYSTVIDKQVQGGVVGVTLGVGNTTSRTNIVTQSELISDLQELSKLCSRKSELDKSIIVQLNNLDLIDNEKEILNFFNTIRNVFQTEGISWILTGSEDLGNLLKRKLSKMGDLISVIKVNELEEDSLVETFSLRSENQVPENVIRKLSQLCRGQYRTINNYIKSYLVGEDFESIFEDLVFDKEIVESVLKGCKTQEDIKKNTGFSGGKVSNNLKLLINSRVLTFDKNGKTKEYRETPEYYIFRMKIKKES